ncbi:MULTISPECIES: O-antigen ligase [unclassified Leptospira]|uniref:O-antigen ligase family protein n=1 Tax=unclassified Leptospira TaxID=2633828 RepID=UPI00055CBC8B|nr:MULTISPECIES: O-antigen ligase family protein [unclassified Leptospira]MCR1794292.1 O-antigen ligase family protein [Leptospira sp. id769339]
MKEFLKKAHLFCLLATLPSIGISVSLSQGFLVLSFFFGLADQLKVGNWKEILPNHPVSKISISLFFWYGIVFLIHLVFGNSGPEYTKSAWNGELKDFFLFFGLLSVGFTTKEDLPKVYRALFWLFLLLVFTGVVGGFTPVRLSRLITDLYKTSTSYRFTHPLGSISSIPLYISIGLMNTHLTFGGLLQFFSAFAVFGFLRTLIQGDKKKILIAGLLLFLYCLVFLLNQARSSMIGAGVSIFFAGIHLFFIRKEFSKSFLIKGASFFLGLLFLIGLVLAFSPAGKKIIGPLFGKEKHTDSGRTFIWDSSFPLIQEHPIIGVGPGNYNKEIEKVRIAHSEKYPELSYFYEVTQRGHAHNDYFHLASVFGLPAVLIYLGLGAILLGYLFQSRQDFQVIIFFYGLIGFFVSGLFQCYFQDDEVVILFWILLGLFVKGEILLSKRDNA